MPRTLLLALIATAMTGSNGSGTAPTPEKTPENARKLPLKGERRGDGHAEETTGTDAVVAL